MSRLRKLKEIKRKKIIRTTMSGLALTLAIGAGQTITTYAWFTSENKIAQNIEITMGTLGVSIMPGLNEDGLTKNDIRKNTFSIENNGTLSQHLSISLDDAIQDMEQWINYEIIFGNYKGKAIKSIKVEDLIGDGVSLRYYDDSLVILESEDVIKATASININEDIPEDLANSFVEESLQFKLSVKATQVNNKDTISTYGFSDIDTQENSLQFEQIESQDEKEEESKEEEVPTEPEEIEPPKEDVEIPIEPEEIEPPKEEVEVPTEPGVIEPPKEEVEVPTKPDVIEPPKENEEIL